MRINTIKTTSWFYGQQQSPHIKTVVLQDYDTLLCFAQSDWNFIEEIRAQQGVFRLSAASSILDHHHMYCLPQLNCLFRMFCAHVLNTYFCTNMFIYSHSLFLLPGFYSLFFFKFFLLFFLWPTELCFRSAAHVWHNVRMTIKESESEHSNVSVSNCQWFYCCCLSQTIKTDFNLTPSLWWTPAEKEMLQQTGILTYKTQSSAGRRSSSIWCCGAWSSGSMIGKGGSRGGAAGHFWTLSNWRTTLNTSNQSRVFQPSYLNRLHPEMLLVWRFAAAVTVQLHIYTVERRPARRRHHLDSGPEPLLELVLSSQSTLRKFFLLVRWFVFAHDQHWNDHLKKCKHPFFLTVVLSSRVCASLSEVRVHVLLTPHSGSQ